MHPPTLCLPLMDTEGAAVAVIHIFGRYLTLLIVSTTHERCRTDRALPGPNCVRAYISPPFESCLERLSPIFQWLVHGASWLAHTSFSRASILPRQHSRALSPTRTQVSQLETSAQHGKTVCSIYDAKSNSYLNSLASRRFHSKGQVAQCDIPASSHLCGQHSRPTRWPSQ